MLSYIDMITKQMNRQERTKVPAVASESYKLPGQMLIKKTNQKEKKPLKEEKPMKIDQ